MSRHVARSCGSFSWCGLLLSAAIVISLFAGSDRLATSADAKSNAMNLNLRFRKETGPASGRWHTLNQSANWDAKKTAVVICDMWTSIGARCRRSESGKWHQCLSHMSQITTAVFFASQSAD